MQDEFTLLKKLIQEHGEPLLDEIASVTEANGQGDCYKCLCNDYCIIYSDDGTSSMSCHDAIKMAIKKDILRLEEEPDGRNN